MSSRLPESLMLLSVLDSIFEDWKKGTNLPQVESAQMHVRGAIRNLESLEPERMARVYEIINRIETEMT